MRRRLACLLLALAIAPTAGAAAPVVEHVGGRGSPVLLVTGPEADAELYQPDRHASEGRGLAGFLVRRGFSVWIADGEALAAAIEQVRAETGSEQLSLVGHGLGGTACYRHLATGGDAATVGGLVTLGAPFGWFDRSALLDEVIRAASRPDVMRYSQLSRIDSVTVGGDLFSASMTALVPDRIDELRARASETGSAAPRAALDDLAGWVGVAADLPESPIPALLICGELDRIAPCEEAWRARDALGPSAVFHKVGYMNLDGMDFGHLDLVLTPEARRRVFPVVARFLRRRGHR